MKIKCLAIFAMLSIMPAIVGVSILRAQEFNCKVQINSEKISGTDKAVYDNLKNAIQEFMNSRKWSNLQLSDNEKIDCSLVFIMKTRSGNTHTCDFQIQSSRPVYGSTYMTSLLNTRQDLTFDFQENQTLAFNETSIDNNLTATIAFWAYVILGLDFDSFSKLGGTPFFQKAQEISSIAQGSLGDSWKAQVDNNNWGWINALTDENKPAMRILSYNYHRLGLDVMYEKPDDGRSQITTVLSELKTYKQVKPRSPLLTNFISSKLDELINIYSKANAQEKQSAFDLLTDVYPASANRLQDIKTKQ
jgi:hypothetical protein